MDSQAPAIDASGGERLDQQTHVGPGGLVAHLGRPDQQPEGCGLFGGQLKSA
jgi:hypothetical protein